MGGWGAFSSKGVPIREIYDVREGGLNMTHQFAANAAVFRNENNYYLANYYEKTGTPHRHSGFESTRISYLPYAMDPIDDRSGSLLRIAQEDYELTCWDSGREVKNSIRLFVREWNTLEEFLSYGSSSGVNGNSDVDGNEGVNCDYDPPFLRKCNDRRDWADLLEGLGGTYDTTDVSNRPKFFPKDTNEGGG